VLQGRSAEERRARAEHYLKLVGLEKLMHRRPSALSGGQQQRVAVARALAAGPRLVLADEPTANLDSENATALLDIMHRLSHEERTTFLFSTHDVRVMERAERIITLRDGRIVSDERMRRREHERAV
jgi:putative ABC transport system ATP-binding protein